MSEDSEIPEDLSTDRRDGMSENVPDPVIGQSLPQALRDAIANFDRYAIQHVRDLLHRAGGSRSAGGSSHNHQDPGDSSGFE